jgi:hypothetical protein
MCDLPDNTGQNDLDNETRSSARRWRRAYALFCLLTRISAVNAVFAYTTLTRAYRRYHEPDTGERELRRKPR